MVLHIVRRQAGTLVAFLRSEAAGGLFLIAASIAALIWSNSAAAPAYTRLLNTFIGARGIGLPVHSLVNDGLMSLFFLLAALEIRREVTRGRLASARSIAAPGIAALGGMVVPALIYLAITHTDPHARRGWAVPVATDIAFSLAVLRLLGRHAGLSLRVFLTALAILDDLGAIAVIAVFYGNGLHGAVLAAAAALWLALLGLRSAGVKSLWPYLVAGAALWLLVFNSGIHATLAGVALALVVPRHAADRLEHALSPLVAYVILPVFGLANAGLDLHAIHPSSLIGPAPLGVLLGLCVGKQAGVFGATMLGRRLGVLHLPAGMTVPQLYGASLLCGIGFTMSLFIGDLAFRDGELQESVKLAVFCGSIVSAVLGVCVLALVSRKQA